MLVKLGKEGEQLEDLFQEKDSTFKKGTIGVGLDQLSELLIDNIIIKVDSCAKENV